MKKIFKKLYIFLVNFANWIFFNAHPIPVAAPLPANPLHFCFHKYSLATYIWMNCFYFIFKPMKCPLPMFDANMVEPIYIVFRFRYALQYNCHLRSRIIQIMQKKSTRTKFIWRRAKKYPSTDPRFLHDDFDGIQF